MQIISLAVMDQKRGLGQTGKLLIHLPSDLKRFKQLTQSHTVLMGRKTYESIGKPLPNRENIVISRQQDLVIPGCVCVNNLEQAIAQSSGEKLFIIGGGEIYKQSMHLVDKLAMTHIHHEFPEADTFFPEIDLTQWKIVFEEHHKADEHNPYDFSFVDYERILESHPH